MHFSKKAATSIDERGLEREHPMLACVAFAALSIFLSCAVPAAAQTKQNDGASTELMEDAKTVVNTSAYVKKPPYKIAALTEGPINGWGITLDTTISYLASKEKDIGDLILTPTMANVDREISAMENTINLKPDLILLQPMSAAGLSAPVARAQAAGIPVVVADYVDGKPYTSYVDVDQYKAAHEAAKALAENLGGKGNVIIINGIPGVHAAEVWKKAAEDVFAKYPGIKVVGNEYANWSIPTAKQKVAALLAANPQIDGVFSGGSGGDVGALLAFEQAGRKQPVYGIVVPVNGWLRLAVEHKVKFTAWPQSPAIAAKYWLETGLKVLRGEQVTKFVHIPEEVITEANAAKNYIPQLNDDFAGPPVAPIDVYIKAGLGRK